jgi:hypothetical protein
LKVMCSFGSENLLTDKEMCTESIGGR